MKKFSKQIDIPFICHITNRKFNSIGGLGIYLTKTLKYNHKKYYDNIIKGEVIKCHFCNNDGRFVSLSKGYTNLCKSDECISKSRSTYTIEGIMYNKLCTKEEAEIIFDKLKLNNKNKNKQISNNLTKLQLKENSNRTKEYWIKRGFTENEAIENISNIQKKNALYHVDKLKTDDIYKEEWTNKQTLSLQYWINKGYNKEEAKQKLKERQQTFSLQKCIDKYGEIEGLKRWQQRQDKWLTTMDAKSPEEKLEINKKRMLNNSGYSKQSQELFWNIYKEFKENNIVFHELTGKEVIMYNKEINNMYKIDFVDFTNKKIIEYNGDFWHCNPELYNESYFNKVKQKYAKDIWEYERIKLDYMKNKGYDILVIWEKDFKHNKEKIIQECIEFIKN